MELMELYNQVQNPIEDPKVIEKLINAYANSSNGFGGFYGQLTKTVEKEHTEGRHYTADADRFYSMMFNKWKNSIVALTREQFAELYKNGSYGQDFIKMRNFLKTVPDVKTKQEANDIFFGKYNDKELEDALDKYRWTAFGGLSGWVHVCSRTVTAKQDKYPNVEHRLYLDTESLDTYKMITYLVEKCDEHHLPYYFKFDQWGNRDDTVVIYSSTENLTKYVEILQEIKKEHQDLVARAKEPPVLTGKIDGWIGYGSEPSRTPDGQNHSFNEIRSNAIEPAIAKTTKKWIMDHRTMQITYQGQKLSFQDYIAMKSTERVIEKLERRFIYNEEKDKKAAQKTGKTYNQNDVVARLGYTLQDVRSSVFKDNVYKVIRAQMGTCLPSICNGTYRDMTEIKMNVRNGKQIYFSGSDLEEIIRGLSVNISKNDPNFAKDVHSAIITNARQYGIDTDKFCFDIKARERMRLVEAQMQAKQQSQPTIQEQKVVQPTKLVQQPHQVETTKKETNIDLANLDVQTLPETINPTLMERKMKLPNGAEISARQYIQEIVYPQLPKNGIVILNNGAPLPAKQFIEECVMFECQEKYNGDFPRYMAERTRNNMGVISIQSNDELHQINPVEITEYINPALLEMRMKLPNGAEISARQYIQEVYAPHIPANGRVMLSNGAEISAKQYIEKVLLWEGQSKYNGDINQILYNTTKRNTGIVNADPQKIQETLLQLRNQATDYTQQSTESFGGKGR